MQSSDPSKRRLQDELSFSPEDGQPGPAKGPYCEVHPHLDPALYINRELSLLAFQWRVLHEACEESNPLLERFKFLSIVGSNLEEFFMVRVAGLKRQLEAGSTAAGPDGLKPREQLDAINVEVMRLLSAAEQCLHTSLLPALQANGIFIHKYAELTPAQTADVDDFFLQKIFPVLTPLAFDPGHPFPHISNLSLNLAIMIRDTTGKERFARLKIPDTLPQLISITARSQADAAPGTGTRPMDYIWLDDLIRANLDLLFPGMTVMSAHTFHVTRDAEVEVQEWEAGDLLETTEQGVRQRRFGDVVRLQVDSAMPVNILEILMSNLQAEPYDVYLNDAHRPFSILKHVAAINRDDLKYPSFLPTIAPELNPDTQEEDAFATIARGNILLHHPYDSFQPLVNFLRLAAEDPQVLAIKMTLYRIGKNSPVVEALLKAMENNKQVAVLVELKARFDEESNIEWAKALEREGVHVVYGLIGLKIHAKVALVVRKEGETIRRYLHLGTGNYNPVTAHSYTDIGLLTSDEAIGSDVTDLFNYLTGYSAKRDYRKLIVAPINMRERLKSMIRREIMHQRSGKNGRVILKVNSLVDEQIIQLLYEASQEGVKIDLLVRGICCLRPGIPGISETIRVVSIVGRFLEHSRIYYFRNDGEPEIYCGSADLMPRNLDRRVEILFPIEDPKLIRFLREDVLETYLGDRQNAWIMKADGTYEKLAQVAGNEGLDSQQFFLTNNPLMKEKLAGP